MQVPLRVPDKEVLYSTRQGCRVQQQGVAPGLGKSEFEFVCAVAWGQAP